MYSRFWRAALGVLAMGAAVFGPAEAAQAQKPPFTQCPAVFQDTSCQFLITITNGGQSIQQDPSQGPYEGSEDALIGVQNASDAPLSRLVMGRPADGIFGFDGDGLCTPGGAPMPAGCPFAPPPGAPAGYASTGYEGPSTWFSAISADMSTGTVNFSPAIPPGRSTYFSLELPPNVQPTVGAPTDLVTSLSGGGKNGGSITVPAGTAVTDSATLSGQTPTASGTVIYKVFVDSACSSSPIANTNSAVDVTSGVVPPSHPVTLPPGTYYLQAFYSGDPNNQPSESLCGSEVVTVTGPGGGTPHTPCDVTMTGGGSFEPTQGVWQDDAGMWHFGDQPGKRLTVRSPQLAIAELDMVQNRPTLVFGTERPGGNRRAITLAGTTDGTTNMSIAVRFKVSQGGAVPRDLYTSPAAVVAGVGPPCGAARHAFAIHVDATNGLPPAPAAPFMFTGADQPYTLFATAVIGGQEFTGLQTQVQGRVDRTVPPSFEFIPATMTAPAPAVAVRTALRDRAVALADQVHNHLADYMPIPNTPGVATHTTAWMDLEQTIADLPAVDRTWVRDTQTMLRDGTLPALDRQAAFQRLVNLLSLGTDYTRYSRTIVVIREADFERFDDTPAETQAISLTQKVIFVKDDSAHWTVGHEFSHTLPYLWSGGQMRDACHINYHNLGVRMPGTGAAMPPDDNLYAHGFQITDGPLTISRTWRDPLASIMESTRETDPQWIDQCTYWHDLHQLIHTPDPPVIVVQGLLARKGARTRGLLEPAYELNSQVDLQSRAGGAWAIVLRGRGGRQLGRFPFTPPLGYDEASIPRPLSAFSYKVPWLGGTRTIELDGPSGTLDRLRMSPHAPTIALRLTRGARPGSVLASWGGRAAGGAGLRYTVLASVDGGESFSPEILESPIRSVRFLVARRSRVVVEVVATDGTRSGDVKRSITAG